MATEPRRRLRTAADVEAAAKQLAESTRRLAARNAEMLTYLAGAGVDTRQKIVAVAEADEMSLEDATERARKHWDKLEARRSSAPPPKGS